VGVNVVDLSNLAWSKVPATWKGRASDDEPGVRFKPFAIPFPGAPTGQLVEYEAGHHEPAHAHQEGELLILIEGDLVIGDTVLAPEAVIAIDGGTTYGPLTSRAGCRFIRIHVDRPTA
jgi:hypothetical protein